MDIIYNLTPIIIFILILVIAVYKLPQMRKSWDKEKTDLAKKIAREIKKKK